MQLSGAVIIAIYAAAYAALHSCLASSQVKRWMRAQLGPRTDCWYRIFFNAVGVLTLLPLGVLMLLLPDQTLYTIPGQWRYVASAAQLLTFLSMAYGLWITDVWHFLGVRQLFQDIPQGCSQRQPPLAVFGLYRWVRHPLYLLSILLIWLTPTMTINLASLYLILTLYLYVGTFFEETRLVEEFGDAYAQYQLQVPRLFPWRGPVNVHITAPPVPASGDEG